MVKPVQYFACSICGAPYEDEAEAEACEKACKKTEKTAKRALALRAARKERIKQIRETVQSPQELIEAINAFSAEELTESMDVKIESRRAHESIGKCNITHRAPFGQKTEWNNYLAGQTGFSLYITYSGKAKYKGESYFSSSDYFHEFGLKTGTGGCSGMDAVMFVKDFPQIQKNLNKLVKEIEDYNTICQEKAEAVNFLTAVFRAVQRDRINRLEEEISRLRSEVMRLEDQTEEYVKETIEKVGFPSVPDVLASINPHSRYVENGKTKEVGIVSSVAVDATEVTVDTVTIVDMMSLIKKS